MTKFSGPVRTVQTIWHTYGILSELFENLILKKKSANDKKGICLFDLILYVPSPIFQLNRDGSSWVEPVLS